MSTWTYWAEAIAWVVGLAGVGTLVGAAIDSRGGGRRG